MRSIALLLLLAGPALAQPLVAPTDAKTPEEERKSFKLPPGFTAQLVASEAVENPGPVSGASRGPGGIQKPMQLAFDAKGRIWVTTSYHYPFAAEKGKASDKLFILSDFDENGKAKKVETFDDKLNIPIGILPLPDCKSCIVSSVGEILKLTDTDGDGKADQREVLFTGFGSRDTHGMYNSYTYMPDGWVYACHGFANDSHVKGKDGHVVHLNSGNTFRFRPDGSRIEVYTRGQVNPFGMTVDPWFNLYTADCHSKPITQLIKGAYYDSFGKPHDGLGYAPHVTRHDHGSTGLCGLAWYDADHFPKEWNGVMFLGNVVTGRINIDRIEWKGSTPVAKELPDFLVSSDPWFRPVDIKLGPDGALYVNDFYNKIIGHYEVDLKHPGRDKGRGRMWRIVNTENPAPKIPFTDLTKEKAEAVAELTTHPNMTVRLLATRELIQRGKDALPAAHKVYGERRANADKVWPALANYHYLAWVITRLEYDNVKLLGLDGGPEAAPVDELLVAKALACRPTDPAAAAKFDQVQSLVRKHYREESADALKSDGLFASIYRNNPRLAIDYFHLDAGVPGVSQIGDLVSMVVKADPADVTIRHAARIAIRNILIDADTQDQLVWALKSHIADTSREAKVLDDVFLGVPTAYAGWWLSERLKAGKLDPQLVERAAQHIGRYGCDCHRNVAWLVAENISELKSQIVILTALQNGSNAAGSTYVPKELNQLAFKARQGLDSTDSTVVIQSLLLSGLLNLDISKKALEIASDRKLSETVRLAAFAALEKQSKNELLPLCSTIVSDANSPSSLKDKAISILATSTKPFDLIALKDMLKTAPFRQCITIANGLAASKSGTDQLFAAVKTGNASARLLQEKTVLERLKATNATNWEATVKELTAGIPSADARLAALIKERGDGYRKSKHDIEAGKKVFTTTCANCHQVGGQGAKVGPQLDGIGNRGVERLMEDTLDPNRNVDHAFHTTILDLKDGGQLTGLLRVEGKVFIMVDSLAKEKRVSIDDVDKKRTSPLSPMPSDIAEKLKPQDFYNLIAYLADLRAK
jgi:putative heme-binding domain-containing protein